MGGEDRPEFCMPIAAPTPNPLEREAETALWEWIAAFDLCPSTASERQIRRGRPAWASAMMYPTAELDVLILGAQWSTLFFLVDDELDEGPAGRDAAACARSVTNLLSVFDGATPADPVGRAFADLWKRLSHGRSTSWRDAFRDDVTRLWWNQYGETVDRIAGRTPSIEEYLEFRRYVVGAPTFLDIVEPACGVDLTPATRHLPALVELRNAAADHVGASNDLWSLQKERASGTPFTSLVSVVDHHHGRGPTEAIGWVNDRATRCLDRLRRAREQLPTQLAAAAIGDEAGRDVLALAEACSAFVSGVHHWHADTDRYTDVEEAAHDSTGKPDYVSNLLLE